MTALLVMLNNYLHDLATAVFAVSAIAALLLERRLRHYPETTAALEPVVRALGRVGFGALIWILAAGVIRALAYRRYEWAEAAGRGQVTVLAVKHVVLVLFTIIGVVALVRLRRRLRTPARIEPSRSSSGTGEAH